MTRHQVAGCRNLQEPALVDVRKEDGGTHHPARDDGSRHDNAVFAGPLGCLSITH